MLELHPLVSVSGEGDRVRVVCLLNPGSRMDGGQDWHFVLRDRVQKVSRGGQEMWAYFVIVLAVAVGAFYCGRWSGMEWVLRHGVIEQEEETDAAD